MHIERIHFDDVFDVNRQQGDFSYTSEGVKRYGARLRRGLIPCAGSTYLVAFAEAGDWSTVLGWRNLDTATRCYREPIWLATLSGIGSLLWLAPFFVFGALLFAGPGAALAVLLAMLCCTGLFSYRLVMRKRSTLRALDQLADTPGSAGDIGRRSHQRAQVT